MRPTNPPFKPYETKEERENSLKSFIRESLDETAAGRVDAIAIVARAPSSPVMAALLAIADELAERRVGVAVVLAGGPAAAENESWSLTLPATFVHEVRLTSNPRVLDGHEQLIVGDRSIWYGDCMRRDPAKRDAFSLSLPDNAEAAKTGRFAFRALWQRAHSIYRSAALASVVVASAEAAAPSVERRASPMETLRHLAENGPSIAETLAAWQPSTRH